MRGTRQALGFLLGALGLLLANAAFAFACTTCYGRAEGPLIDAARLGIWLLLGLTLCVQGGFVAFFLYLRRRAALAASGPEAGRRTAAAVPGGHVAQEGIHG